MPTYAARIPSPIGDLTAVIDSDGALVRLLFPDQPFRQSGDAVWDEARCAHVKTQMDAYFRGELRAFTLPLAPRGTDFQRRVWDELTRIEYGDTITYRDLAERVGRPTAVRAAGRANATNPIPIIVPCHRVIGVDGSLTGYGGGLALKEWLLDFEGAD